MKTAKMAENSSFADASIVVYSHGIEILSGPQIVGHKPRKQQKWPKSRVLPMPRYSCNGGHSTSKSSQDHKSWVITHENGKNGRNHEFCRCLDIRVSGITGHRNPPETTKHGLKPMKTAKMVEVTSFSDASIVVYRGSQCIEILPGPEIVGSNPRKRPKMAEIGSFVGASIVV